MSYTLLLPLHCAVKHNHHKARMYWCHSAKVALKEFGSAVQWVSFEGDQEQKQLFSLWVGLVLACVVRWSRMCQSSRCCSSHVDVGMALYGSMMTLAQRMIMAISSRQRKATPASVRPWSTSTKAGSAVASTSMMADMRFCLHFHQHSPGSSWRPEHKGNNRRKSN